MSLTDSAISASCDSSSSSRASSCSTSASSSCDGQRVVGRQVVADVGVLGGQRLGRVGVVPEVGPAHLGLQLGQPVARLADAQVRLGLAEPAAQLAQVVGEVTHAGSALSWRRGTS